MDFVHKMNVDLVLGEDGKLEGPSVQRYVSSKAYDREEDQINMKFLGTNEMIQAEQTTNNEFIISVDKTLLKRRSR